MISNQPLRTKVFLMDSNNPGSVHYNRWNEDNINIDVEGSQPTLIR